MTAFFHLAVVAADSSSKPTASPLATFLPILLIGAVFYFLLIRPQQRKQKAARELTQSIDVGDEIVTIGGLYGVVTELDDDSVLLTVAPGTELRFLRSAIARKLLPEDEAQAEDEDADEVVDEDAGTSGYIEPDEEFGKGSEAGGKP